MDLKQKVIAFKQYINPVWLYDIVHQWLKLFHYDLEVISNTIAEYEWIDVIVL